MKLTATRCFLHACVLLAVALPVRATVFVNANSTWRYLKGTAEASSPDLAAWRLTGFNDGSWLIGNAPFYYEANSGTYDPPYGVTFLSDMQPNYTCIFMRKTFNVADPALVAHLLVDLQSDDGCIAWINGVEVANLGRPTDATITFQSLAPNAAGEPKTGLVQVDNPASFLVAGDNVIAVQAFNQSATSSDFLIELALSSVDYDPPPTVVSKDPAPGFLQELTQITVTFSEAVDGVNGSDMLVNGIPATSLIGDGAVYTFYFPQPPFGPVQISWAANHGIKGQGVLGGTMDPNLPGNTWQYTLADTFPPLVASISPHADNIVRSLTSIVIEFNEGVTGVNASDLTIAGSPATSLDVLSSSRYVFNFPQPATGAVSVAWIASHGITDEAALPNNFAGGSWSYTLDPNADPATLLITEFMAVNDGLLADEDGDFSDWIEIYNGGQTVAELSGYYLTDKADNLTKWEFPETNLLAGAYMIVFASEKNRSTPGAPLHTNFKLGSTGEFLALVKPDGVTLASAYTPQYPLQVADVSYGLSSTSPPGQGRYFTVPTPGEENGVGVGNLGPIIHDLTRSPAEPLPTEALTVSVGVSPAFDPVGTVTLRYRIMYNAETALPMAAAGVGIYTAVIPAGIADAGQMIRWYVSATDTQGRISRYPAFEDPLNSPEYDGTIVFQEQTNPLPVLHWFAQNPAAADSDIGTQSSLYFEGEFYDNVNINWHGQSSLGFPKKSYDIDFHPGYNFRWNQNESRVDDINLLTTYPDKAHMRNALAYGTFRDAGGAYHFVEPVRVQQNGTFAGDWHIVENGDDNWLERLGMDPNGALYKMYNGFWNAGDTVISPTEAEKKTRKYEGSQDLQDFLNAITSSDPQVRANCLFDNVDLPSTVNYLAVQAVTGVIDTGHKNYYLYRDTEGTGEWQGMPWDMDLSFGRVWNSTDQYWDNDLKVNAYLQFLNNNGFFSKIESYPPTKEMYYRRIRTLMDTLLQPPDTPPTELKYEQKIDELVAMLGPDAALDLALHGTWFQSQMGPFYDTNHPDYMTLDEAVVQLKQYLHDRRVALYNRTPPKTADIPDAQPTNTVLNFGSIDYNPSSGNQAQEYIQIINNNAYAVDISGWQLTGAITHTFKGGTVIPAGFPFYVSPDVKAFRARTISPKAGEGRFVQGNYKGQLSARGESVYLVNDKGWTNQATSYPGNPTPAQARLRITEIMYHPVPPPPGSPYGTEDFEYIELKNIGAGPLALAGIRFTEGVVFDFTGPLLLGGQSVVVVKNQAAFLSRYGNGFTIAGTYGGSLANNGETVRLDDEVGEKILDFDYNNSWYPITDGAGFSLVIADENAPYNTWDMKESWRPSGSYNGSPGEWDPAPIVVAPVLVNEALTHTDLPQVDTIELYNNNALSVNIGGWFLSDDLSAPTKYRIPDNTLIPAHGYLKFDENQFNPNPGVPPSFSLNSTGDEVHLFSGNGTEPTGYYHGFDFGAIENGVTFGRYVTSVSEEHFVAQSSNTILADNAAPKVGPVVISEIMYHPQDFPNRIDNDVDEFIELHNISGATVFLYDPSVPTNTWQLGDAVKFAFDPTTSLAAGAYLLVVSFDPVAEPAKLAAFRIKYDVPAAVAVQGPYRGQLDNSNDAVELYKPDSPNPDMVPYILVDRVEYQDNGFWPQQADGTGASLQRINDPAYGDDPINWFAGAPSAGAPSAGAPLPVITAQPVAANGVLGGTAQLTVSATGIGLLSYQWRKNGILIPGATGDSFMINNITIDDDAFYDVLVTDNVATIASDSVHLTVLVDLSVVQAPITQTVSEGQPVVFSIETDGTLPIGYHWRIGSDTLHTDTLNSHTAFLVITNAQLGNYPTGSAGAYSVVLTNAAFSSPGLLVDNFNLVVLADSDGDGIPDAVETANGWNPNNPSDADADTDEDGSSNGNEYIAGTDWNNPDSYLKIENLSMDGGANIEFMAASNLTYTVEYKNSLSDFSWSRLADVVASSSNTIVVVTDTEGSPSRVYRLVTPRKPE